MLTKADILAEIKKEATQNGGTPLSEKRFKERTGIIPYEWHKYWARFGDAQREAGFSPNKFLKVPYEDSFLLEKFILLMRELNKWPTKGEIVVKHNTSRDFPSEKVFYDRLGLKPILAKKVLEYARDRKYSDIVKICQNTLKGFENSEEQIDVVEKAEGSVYLARSGPYYKIGRTNHMGRRHREITIQLPDGFELIHEIKTDDPVGIEAYWHRRFQKKRKRGEWFDLQSSDVGSFKRWRKIN